MISFFIYFLFLLINKYESSSSSRAGSTDIRDPLSPLFPVVYRFRQVFWTTSCILILISSLCINDDPMKDYVGFA